MGKEDFIEVGWVGGFCGDRRRWVVGVGWGKGYLGWMWVRKYLGKGIRKRIGSRGGRREVMNSCGNVRVIWWG